MPLVLTVRPGTRIHIGDSIEIFVTDGHGPHQLRLSINAPKGVSIIRGNAKVKLPARGTVYATAELEAERGELPENPFKRPKGSGVPGSERKKP